MGICMAYTILIADDEAEIRDILHLYLEQAGFHVVEAADGLETLSLLEKEAPDLLLLDEPFSALDYQTRLNVSDDIGKILKKQKKPAILVTHDISEAISMADRVIVLTSRPAAISRIIPINLGIQNRTPISSRNAPVFKSYFNLIWKELNQNA